MAEDHAARIERMEKTQQEMQKRMIDMMKILMKRKGSADSSGQESGIAFQEGRKEDLTHLLRYIPPQMQAYQGAYPPTMSLV